MFSFTLENNIAGRRMCSLYCTAGAIYKQLTLSSADWVYWIKKSAKQTSQICSYSSCVYLSVINSGEVSLLCLAPTKEKDCPKVYRDELHALLEKMMASLGAHEQVKSIFMNRLLGRCLTCFCNCRKKT